MKSLLRATATMAAALGAAFVILCGTAGRGLLAQNAAPGPAGGVRVWTSDIVSDDLATKTEATLRPVSIAGPRNGTFSGKVVVDSMGAIKGLRASLGDLTGKGGAIPAKNVQVRYSVGWDRQDWGRTSGPDILLEAPPAQVAPVGRGRAVAPVWITVKVPKDAKAGTYAGELTVQADGLAATKVPVNLEVLDWTLPDTQDYRTFLDFIQSPDTLALEYHVPLWSEKHWELIARSFRLIGETGSRVLYVPLMCRTNFGNEESMVRWIRKGENKYENDYSIMDKYLDVAEKNMGKPKLVIFVAWDICLSPQSLQRGLWGGDNPTREGRQELLGKGPRVTSWDPATKEANFIFLPRYDEPEAKAIWQPVWAQIRKKMEARKLDKTMMLGIIPDLQPTKVQVAMLNEVTGGLAWAFHAHAGARVTTAVGNKFLHGIADLGYAAHVYALTYQANPDKGRLYGWRLPTLVSHFPRGGGLNMSPCVEIRHLQEFNITGGQRGAGRLGADIWHVVKDKKGLRVGSVYLRYPENNWRNLDIGSWFLAPGPEGALATARFENLREGTQECEARIFLEDMLLDPAKKAKVGADLAQRCQAILDEHHRAMWKTVWSNDDDLKSVGTASAGRNPVEGLWYALVKTGKKLPGYWDAEARKMRSDEARKGIEWWFASGWQERNRKLFVLAGEAAAKLGPRK